MIIEPKFIPLYAFVALLIGTLAWNLLKLIVFVIGEFYIKRKK